MRGDCVRFKDQILVAFAGMLAGSCILTDKCIYFFKEGYRWEVVLSGEGINPDTGQPQTIPGVGFDCFTPDENALLLAKDENNQDFLALRNGLLVAAQMDCVAGAAGSTSFTTT
jgi:hypothetical protein